MEQTGLFQVDTFNDSQLALSKFKADLYDIVILDIRMPEMDGFELYRNIKKKDNEVNACFFTAGELEEYYGEQILDIISALGKDCIIPKPIENEKIIAQINAKLS